MEKNESTFHHADRSDDFPSIFDDSDNVYNTYPLPSDDPRKVQHYCKTSETPIRRRKAA